MAKTELVRCLEHGESSCWVQSSGEHISRYACTCKEREPFLCPIDAHSIRYLLENPEWSEELPKTYKQPEPKPHPQDCSHRGAKELIEIPGQIRAWLCKNCKKELEERLGEKILPPTPIELYAQRSSKTIKKGVNTMKGCNFNVGTREKGVDCGKVVDLGQTQCPRHIEVSRAPEAEKAKKDAAKAAKLRAEADAKNKHAVRA